MITDAFNATYNQSRRRLRDEQLMSKNLLLNTNPAEPWYALPLQTVDPDQLASSVGNSSDLDLHCLSLIVSI